MVVVLGVNPTYTDYLNDVVTACPTPSNAQACSQASTWRVLRRYFQSNYQTYGRKVHLIAYDPQPQLSGQALANGIAGMHPFAVVGTPSDNGGSSVEGAGDANPYLAADNIEWFTAFRPGRARGTDLTGGNVYLAQGYYRDAALDQSTVINGIPYFWSFQPSAEDIMANGVMWVCNSIQGRPAIYGTKASSARTQDHIALGYDDSFDALDGTGSTIAQLAASFAGMVKRQCGYQFHAVGELWDSRVTQTSLLTSDQIVSDKAVAAMAANNDTSVLCLFCDYSVPDTLAQSERSQQYSPEFMFVGGNLAQSASARDHDAVAFNNAFGLSELWQLPSYVQTHWFAAYSSTDPTSVVSQKYGMRAYENLMQLYAAIQLGGPALTPTHVANGDSGSASVPTAYPGLYGWQRSFDASNRTDPSSPAAGYDAPLPGRTPDSGHHAFLKGMIEVRWDSSQAPPGGAYPDSGLLQASGCYVVTAHDKRFGTETSHGQTPYTAGLDPSGPGPCTGDTYGLAY